MALGTGTFSRLIFQCLRPAGVSAIAHRDTDIVTAVVVTCFITFVGTCTVNIL